MPHVTSPEECNLTRNRYTSKLPSTEDAYKVQKEHGEEVNYQPGNLPLPLSSPQLHTHTPNLPFLTSRIAAK